MRTPETTSEVTVSETTSKAKIAELKWVKKKQKKPTLISIPIVLL